MFHIRRNPPENSLTHINGLKKFIMKQVLNLSLRREFLEIVVMMFLGPENSFVKERNALN
jgi:hypothetical protein